jgi:hypothetical protein
MNGYGDEFDSQPQQVPARRMNTVNDFRALQMHNTKPDVSPATYTPKVDGLSTTRNARDVSFGHAPRFADSKLIAVSRHHNADSMGQHSPGPKYNPDFRTNRVPGLSWGPPVDQAKLRRRELLKSRTMLADVGPAAYHPNLDSVREQRPRNVFSKSARFSERRIEPLHANSSPTMLDAGAGASAAPLLTDQNAFKHTVSAAPAYSFGGVGGPDGDRTVAGTNTVFGGGSTRTTFLTHNINGGLAKPATLDSSIGPADYVPEGGWRTNLLPRPQPEFSFSRADRFLRDDLQFLSREHSRSKVGVASPGPCYFHEQATMGHKKHVPRASTTKWCP